MRIKFKNQKKFQGLKNDNKLKKLDYEIDNCQNEIRETINKLNDKEQKIYEIQKRNLDIFKEEIIKYQNIYNELKNKSENIKQQNKKIPKNNENQKNPINYNNFNMTKFDYKNDKILMNPGLKDNKIFKVSDYTNTNLNKNNNFMNYTPINRQQEIYNNNPLMKNNFIEYNISKNQNITKPINNFNPNLMKKNRK